jgi:hypothetical protein
MMVHVMPAELSENRVLDTGEKMHGIVNHVVSQVAEDESAGKGPASCAQHQKEYP